MVGQGDFELRLPGYVSASGGLDPRVAGLLYVTSGEHDDVVRALRAALTNPEEATREAWRDFIRRYLPKPIAPVQRACVNGHPMGPGERFCGKCGFPLKESTSGPVEPWRPPFEDAPQAVKDLGAMAALMAYRRLSPSDWKDLVMKRSRLIGN